jgi:hypothetical protein
MLINFIVDIFQAIEKEQGSSGKSSAKKSMIFAEGSERSMQSLQEALTALFATAVEAAFPDLPDAPVVLNPSTNAKFGDYQCNSAMGICQVNIMIKF